MEIKNIDEWQFAYDNNLATAKNYVAINAIRLDKFIELKILVNDSNLAIEEIAYRYNWKKDAYHNLNDSLLYQINELEGKVVYKENTSKYYLHFMENHVRYTAIHKRTYKRESDREVKNEFVVFSSHQMTDLKNKKNEIIRDKKSYRYKSSIIVNKKSYCEAAVALNQESGICN